MVDRNFLFHFQGDIYPSRSGIEDPNQPDAMQRNCLVIFGQKSANLETVKVEDTIIVFNPLTPSVRYIQELEMRTLTNCTRSVNLLKT